MALTSLAMPDTRSARIVRIADTLSLVNLEVSEPLLPEVQSHPNLAIASTPSEMLFDQNGNLFSLG
jgi:hypothetical protein